MKALLLLAPLCLALAGCTSGGKGGSADGGSDSTTPKATYVMHFTATPRSGKTILVNGRTNLPDGATITITATQACRFKREADTRATRIAGASEIVEDGKFVTTLGPLDYKFLTVGLVQGEGDTEYGPGALVDNAVTVCATLGTGKDTDGMPRQSDEAVQEALGSNGENLKSSPQMTEFGSASPTPSYWLEVTRRVRGAAPGVVAAVTTAQGSRPVMGRLSGFCIY